MNQNPDLVIQQAAPNYTLGTAQNVSPQWFGSDALGSTSPSVQSEYFSINANVGATINFAVNSTNPTSQDVELLLYDANQNLVAIADGNGPDGHSSIIAYTVPSGDAGTWYSQVDVPSEPAPAFDYDLRLTGSTESYVTDVDGALTNAGPQDFYSLNANAGDLLHFYVQSEDSSDPSVELLLYDANGNLVAIADGNAPDGNSSIIDYTVPSGDAGNWTAGVTDTTGDSLPYDLQISGATGLGSISPIPEPGTLGIFGASVLGLYKRRRR
jgi:hypothetical protein